jgi:hypothetical protein
MQNRWVKNVVEGPKLGKIYGFPLSITMDFKLVEFFFYVI